MMRQFILTKYSVRGIKNLDNWISLSFFKSTFAENSNTKGYNVKGIYGENGAGKSGIITSVKILKELIVNQDYLNNKAVQRKIGELINKKLGFLEFDVEFYSNVLEINKLFRYRVKICINSLGKYVIDSEQLSCRKASSHNNSFTEVFNVDKGEILDLNVTEDLSKLVREKTKNLLQDTTLAVAYLNRILFGDVSNRNIHIIEIVMLFLFGNSLFVHMDSSDDHTEYLIDEAIKEGISYDDELVNQLIMSKFKISESHICALYPDVTPVLISGFDVYERQVDSLCEFLRKFKNGLNSITIDKTLDGKCYRCRLIMNYDNYSVDAEYESTGIKKLIRIYSYLQKMVNGEIVFIDELDSNLHDVYLCALLEYLTEYGEGQLCFTTHNIGPMDILKRNRKSIDFLSTDGKIVSWVKNGNYSPSKLYREGMIEGSPFNVDSIDFIGVFESEESGV